MKVRSEIPTAENTTNMDGFGTCEVGTTLENLKAAIGGETGASASLAHYKQRFGATPHPHAEYFLERLPITAVDSRLRKAAKWMIGFKDT